MGMRLLVASQAAWDRMVVAEGEEEGVVVVTHELSSLL